MPRRMVFGEVVSHVALTFSPKQLKLLLVDSVSKPVEAHVEGFGEVLTKGRSENASRGGVVVEERSTMLRLRVTELEEGDSYGASFLSCEKETTSFSFSGRGHNIFERVAHNIKRSIWYRCRCRGRVIAKDKPRI